MKTYTITTDDDKQLARAVQADGLAWIVHALDAELRSKAKYSEDERAQRSAEYWRDRLRSIAGDNDIAIGGLFE
tara:strand:- start:22176 stop:22397 length:222 start_codon:yes stop_codon:yes gene_type:complete